MFDNNFFDWVGFIMIATLGGLAGMLKRGANMANLSRGAKICKMVSEMIFGYFGASVAYLFLYVTMSTTPSIHSLLLATAIGAYGGMKLVNKISDHLIGKVIK